MFELRPYQIEGRDKIRDAFAGGARRVLYTLPTGGGKTATFSHIAAGVYHKRKRVVILAHRDFLLDQISEALREWRVPHGILTGGRIGVPRHHVVVASVMTLKNRIRHIPAPDLMIGDEAHHFARENTWGKIVQAWPTSKVLGVTATPVRTDQQPLGNMFDEMVVGPSVAELTALGYLSPTEVYAPSVPDLSGVSRRMGDYAVGDLEVAMDKPSLTGSAVTHYQKITPGKKGVAFCVSLKHAEDVAQAFRVAGVASEIISGKMDRGERNAVLRRFTTGETKVMTACDLISEGFNCPAIDVAILLRPTQSLGLYMQQVGRAIRISPGKRCLAAGTKILTHRGLVLIENISHNDLLWDGNSWNRHGGVIPNGERDVITYQGLTATPDHEVWTQEGWRSLGYCAAKQITPIQTGFGGSAVRLSNDHLPPHRVAWRSVEQKDICPHPLSQLLNRAVDFLRQFKAWAHSGLSKMQSACAISEMALCTHARGSSPLRECWHISLSHLWRSRHYVQFFESGGCGSVGEGEPRDTGKLYRDGNRPNRQRQGVWAWESPLVNAETKSISHHAEEPNSSNPRNKERPPRGEVRRQDAPAPVRSRTNSSRDHRQIFQSPVLQTKRQVWDILDAGPRNSFTAENFLTHNCTTILDHAGNTAKHGFIDAPRDWDLYAGDERERSEDKVPAVRTCAKCFAMYKPAPACPRCGYVPPVRQRKIVQKEGELEMVADASAYEAAAAPPKDPMAAYTSQYFQLVNLGKKRRMNNPVSWALSIVSARLARDLAKTRPAGDGTVNGLYVGELDELRRRTVNRATSKETQ